MARAAAWSGGRRARPSTGCAGLVYDGAAGHLREELLEHAVGPHLDVGVPLGKVAQVCGLDGQLEAEQLVVGLEVAQLEYLLGGARRAGRRRTRTELSRHLDAVDAKPRRGRRRREGITDKCGL